MTNLKKYTLIAALVLPTVFAGKSAEASSAVINNDRADAVNVRSEANEGNNIIGLINDKTSYEVKDNSNGWLKIDFDGKEAYVGSYWFNLTETTKITAASNFRKSDNISSEILSVLEKGDEVEVIEYANNNYVKVKFDGKEGYVFKNNLDLSKISLKDPAATNYQASSSNNSSNYQASNYTSYQEVSYSESASTSYTGTSSSAKEIIAQRESGGSYSATNGQYIGRYQLSASYLNGDYSAENQERVADNYVAQRYGSWDAALSFWNNNGWY